MENSLAALKGVIDAGQFEELIGTLEGDWLDVKGQPYQFDKGEFAKREFAKDVSAFANASGGFILVGFTTDKSATHPGEVIAAMRPIDAALFDRERHMKLASEWVYPEIRGIDCQWQQAGVDPEKGIGVVYVPPQDDRSKPFLIKKYVEGQKCTETIVGYAERKRDSTNIRSVVELHQALRMGLTMDQELIGRLVSIERLIEQHYTSTKETLQSSERNSMVDERISAALDHEGMESLPSIVLAITPMEPVSLQTLFSDGPDSIRRKLECPPQLRPSGWDLGTLDRAKFVEGKYLRVTNGDRKVVDLYRDGGLVFAGLANSKFLGWGGHDIRRLHPLAFIELVVSFTLFYKLVIADCAPLPKTLDVRLQLRHMHAGGQKSCLLPYGVDTWEWSIGRNALEAPKDSWSIEKVVAVSEFVPKRVAYELVQEAYFWFGHPEEVIPFVKELDGTKIVDTDKIAQVR